MYVFLYIMLFTCVKFIMYFFYVVGNAYYISIALPAFPFNISLHMPTYLHILIDIAVKLC